MDFNTEFVTNAIVQQRSDIDNIRKEHTTRVEQLNASIEMLKAHINNFVNEIGNEIPELCALSYDLGVAETNHKLSTLLFTDNEEPIIHRTFNECLREVLKEEGVDSLHLSDRRWVCTGCLASNNDVCILGFKSDLEEIVKGRQQVMPYHVPKEACLKPTTKAQLKLAKCVVDKARKRL